LQNTPAHGVGLSERGSRVIIGAAQPSGDGGRRESENMNGGWGH